MAGYDTWKTTPPAMASGNGQPFKLPMLCCTVCEWHGDHNDAVAHFRLTDHPISYKGHVQDFSRYRVTAEELVDRR